MGVRILSASDLACHRGRAAAVFGNHLWAENLVAILTTSIKCGSNGRIEPRFSLTVFDLQWISV
jgi:hypothetical protein